MEFDLQQKPSNGFNAFTLKLVAILGMTLDHSGIVFSEWLPLWGKTALFALGGLTFPIMAYLLVEGYKHTSNFKRYASRLLLFAILSAVPYMWAMGGPALNVLFTLLLGLISLYLFDHMKNRIAFWFAFAGFCLISIIMDWSLIGVPMVLLYYILQAKWKKLIIPVSFSTIFALGNSIAAFIVPSMSFSKTIPSLAFALIGCSLTIPLLANYNGQRGPSLKYLFYLYYPLHLLVLALIRGFLFHEWVLF